MRGVLARSLVACEQPEVSGHHDDVRKRPDADAGDADRVDGQDGTGRGVDRRATRQRTEKQQ